MKNLVRRAKSQGFTLIELMIVVAIVGILAVLAIYGVSRYLANAKTAEARNSLGQLSKDAVSAYEKEAMASAVLAPGGSTATLRSLCQSATKTVPASAASIKGKKYQASNATGKDWNTDAATNKGFACLKFAMDSPQYYMYDYKSDSSATSGGTGFTATANGDLDGNGTLSTFEIFGKVQNGALNVAPNLKETNPEE